MKITTLNQEQMKQIITMKEAIEADKEALAIYSAGASIIPLRDNIEIKKYNGQSLYMPGYAEDAQALGVKIVSVYPNNISKGMNSIPASMILLNVETGEIKAILDGTFLTQLRTGAIAGAATDLLAKLDSKNFALFGTGGQAESQLEAVLAVRPINCVKVFDIDILRSENFVVAMQNKFGKKYDIKISVAKNPQEAISDADIITAVTTSEKPVFMAKDVPLGAHINGVGSYTPAMQEIPGEIFTKATKIYVDTRDGVLNEAGDFIRPLETGLLKKDQITGELGELILSKKTGREEKDEITIFKTTGSAILDIVVAQKIYEQAIEKQIGKTIEI